MEEIKRDGPPKPVDVRGTDFRLRVPLNISPRPEWVRFFQDPSEWTSMCHPKLIDVEGDALEFVSDEGTAPTWIQYIDRWIDGANRRYAEYVESLRGKETARAEAARERQRQLEEAAEKFKKLT
jgi:hypothetical protein